ncbi:MAG TPA: long-chain fatty acid--CoA ligase [Geminicoccus sp.]|uniref:AMP-dependent synthetase/ligase n=1 Tax=Geminicoccus sp. TaxID=2024832 RepID=UPI002E376EBD|nr:long-chain fatty acid--CoA ligase [Geminicoccus sp.]HEX2528327.1 long-chain fatty acid--CoA ligase [Geminicoccus sp.]
MTDFGGNLVEMFQKTVQRKGEAPFLWAKSNGTYRSSSFRNVADDVQNLARALAQLGVEAGDRVLLVSENRPEWCIADLAVVTLGGITVPAYTTNTIDDHAYLLSHSQAKLVICSGRSLAKRLIPAMNQTGTAQTVLFMEPLKDVGALPVSAFTWKDALALGSRSSAVPEISPAAPDDIACLIYTSGTGGRPKGVMLTHRNIMANLMGAHDLLLRIGLGDEVFLSFLPLSHSYEHTAGQFLPIALGAEIYYAEGTETIRTNLLEARPTIMTCVPRLYEVLRQRINAEVQRQGGLKARLFAKTIELGKRKYEQGRLGLVDSIADQLLDRLVRDKIRGRFGGRLKALVSGGAPLNQDVGMFFHALGLPILQGYGQTEASPVVAVNPPGAVKLDTVGPPLKGVQVKIAEDGEILVAGDLVMKGYWRDEEATRHALREGWLHTGDVGMFDEDGYLKITDRKKDIIVVSGGDNVSPQRVEGVLGLRPEVGQVVIYGDGKPFLVALIVPEAEFAKQFAKARGKSAELAELVQDEEFRKAMAEGIKQANENLSAIERIRRWQLLDEPFTTDNGLMTPSLKLRRSLIYARYESQIRDLYD